MVHLLHRLYGVDAPGRDDVSTKLRRARLVLRWVTVFAHEYTTGFFAVLLGVYADCAVFNNDSYCVD